MVTEYLDRTEPEGFPSGDEFRRLSVEIDKQGRVHIGSWVYDVTTHTLTHYMLPDRRVGYDLIIQLLRHGQKWKVERVERIEIFLQRDIGPVVINTGVRNATVLRTRLRNCTINGQLFDEAFFDYAD